METDRAHIVSKFDEDMETIERFVTEMGGLVEHQIEHAVTALNTKDLKLSDEVIVRDRKVDELEHELDQAVVKVLALRQPQAQDLRFVIGALRIAGNLERIGDYTKNIAKRNRVLATSSLPSASLGTIKRMGKLTSQMVNDVITAYLDRDTDKAEDVRLNDREVDQLYNTLFRELLTYMMEDPRMITPCMHMLFIAKNIERMGDHATSIAEQVIYMVSGAMPEDMRPKSDNTPFVNLSPEE